MVTKGKLRMALAAETGFDLKKLQQEKKYKEAVKRKKAQLGGANKAASDADGDSAAELSASDEADEDVIREMNLDAIDESDTSESSLELEPTVFPRRSALGAKAKDEAADEDEEDIPISDLEDLDDDDKDDLIPHTRLTINNTSALIAALDRISIPTGPEAPFATHQSVVASNETAESIPDVSDDLQRELAFYSQCLEAARHGRTKLLAEGVPFSRPKDYFAEMIKEDAHMDKVKAKLIEEAASKKASAEARKLRDLKKFGKQVQVAKLQERHKAKRDTLDKIKTLKRKRQESGGNAGTNEADLFDVGVDNEISKKSRHAGPGKRQKKDEKYGFGKKRHAKSGDAVSSGDLSGFDAKKMKAGARSKGAKTQRPGKGRRRNMAGK